MAVQDVDVAAACLARDPKAERWMKSWLAIETEHLNPEGLELGRPGARAIEATDRDSESAGGPLRQFDDQSLGASGIEAERDMHDVRYCLAQLARCVGRRHQIPMINLDGTPLSETPTTFARSADAGESRPVRLLAVSSEFPWPLDSGGHLRTFHLLRALARRFEVHLLASGGVPPESARAALRAAGVAAEGVASSPAGVLRETTRAAVCRARREPYVMYGRHRHRATMRVVQRFFSREHPDVLYCDHLDAVNYADCCPGALVVVDLHNIYSLIAERAAAARKPPVSWYLRGEAELLRVAEREAAARADMLFAVSNQERDYYLACGGRRVHVIPNGVDCEAYRDLPVGRAGSSLILYVGSMSWPPNAEAALFLADQVLPAVRARHPDARLRIVGRDPPQQIRAAVGRNIEVTGTVESVLPHLREAALLAVPLRTGGGTRLKILEALAAGLPVVSTAVGAEGLELTAGEHLRVVTHGHFADAITELLNDPASGAALARAGRIAVRERYDWSAIGQNAVEAITTDLWIRSQPPARPA